MAQLILEEPTEILAVGDTEGTELDENWEGIFEMTLYVASTDAVKLEKKRPDTDDWVVARRNGEEIEMDTAGDTLDINISSGDIYRLAVDTAGAVVYIMSKRA